MLLPICLVVCLPPLVNARPAGSLWLGTNHTLQVDVENNTVQSVRSLQAEGQSVKSQHDSFLQDMVRNSSRWLATGLPRTVKHRVQREEGDMEATTEAILTGSEEPVDKDTANETTVGSLHEANDTEHEATVEEEGEAKNIVDEEAVNSAKLSILAKSLVVKAHNQIRNCVDPPAREMEKLDWDEELEVLSAAHVSKCVFEHYSPFDHIYALETANPLEAVESWYKLKDNYSIDENTCTEENMDCRLYAQLVFFKNTKIGCGMKDCTDSPRWSMPSPYFLLCTYERTTTGRPYDKKDEAGPGPTCLDWAELHSQAVGIGLIAASTGSAATDTSSCGLWCLPVVALWMLPIWG